MRIGWRVFWICVFVFWAGWDLAMGRPWLMILNLLCVGIFERRLRLALAAHERAMIDFFTR